MSLELGFMYLIALGRGEVSWNISPPDSEVQYILDPRPKPIGDLFLNLWTPAEGTPLYGIQNLIDPSLIPENQPIYNESGQLQAGSMNILNWNSGPTYTPPPLEFR
jgi:hypothetical protein